nr:lysophospholipid acyltransferase family protein [Pseudaestuariivita rosea]
MAIMGIGFAPLAMFSGKVARWTCYQYARWAQFSAKWILGLRTEIRGTPPTDEVMIAAKHQSFLDIMMIYAAIPMPKFIMKKELLWAPFIGQYAYRMGCVPVDRNKRGKAIPKMLEDVSAGRQNPGQLVIYPQGTRVAPGVKADYKIGTYLIYEQLGQPCVPVATNVGVFWPRKGIMRKPGVAVVEFLDPIPPGLSRDDFMTRMVDSIEAASDRLMEEAQQYLT